MGKLCTLWSWPSNGQGSALQYASPSSLPYPAVPCESGLGFPWEGCLRMWPSPTLEAGIAVWPESPRDDGQNVQGRPVHVVSVRQNMVVGSSCPFLREGVIEAFILESMSCTWTRPSSSLSEQFSIPCWLGTSSWKIPFVLAFLSFRHSLLIILPQ